MKSIISIFFLSFILYQSVIFAQDSRDEIITIFDNYIRLNSDFIKSVSDTSPTHSFYYNLRDSVEAYSENKFDPILEKAKSVICIKNDSLLLYKYIKVLINTTNSADEYPNIILGEIYICKSDLFIQEFKKLNKVDRAIIFEIVELGFNHVTFGDKEKTPNYLSLKTKLENLKVLLK